MNEKKSERMTIFPPKNSIYKQKDNKQDDIQGFKRIKVRTSVYLVSFKPQMSFTSNFKEFRYIRKII